MQSAQMALGVFQYYVFFFFCEILKLESTMFLTCARAFGIHALIIYSYFVFSHIVIIDNMSYPFTSKWTWQLHIHVLGSKTIMYMIFCCTTTVCPRQWIFTNVIISFMLVWFNFHNVWVQYFPTSNVDILWVHDFSYATNLILVVILLFTNDPIYIRMNRVDT
jgi:hypothetical protein